MNGRALMVVVSLSLVFGIVIVVGLEGPEVLVPRPIPAAHSGGAMTAIPLGVSATLSPSLTPTHTPTGVFSPRSTSTAELRVTPSSLPTPTPTIVPPTPTGEAASPTMAMAAPASCARIDFEVIQASTKTADAGLGPTELVWRVRNRATDAECMWGGGGQETDTLYAREMTGQVTETQQAKLTWVGENEYDLALVAPPGLQQYTLVWRLMVPATGQEGGPELVIPARQWRRRPRRRRRLPGCRRLGRVGLRRPCQRSYQHPSPPPLESPHPVRQRCMSAAAKTNARRTPLPDAPSARGCVIIAPDPVVVRDESAFCAVAREVAEERRAVRRGATSRSSPCCS